MIRRLQQGAPFGKRSYRAALLGVFSLTLFACQNSADFTGSQPSAPAPTLTATPLSEQTLPEVQPSATAINLDPQPSDSPSPNVAAHPGPSPTPDPLPSPAPSPAPTNSPLLGVPDAPLNPRIVENAADSITMLWDFDAKNPVTYTLYLDGQVVASNHTSPNYYRFTQLEKDKTYTLGVSAVNAAGESEKMTLTTFTTLQGRSARGNFAGGGGSSATPTPVPTPIPTPIPTPVPTPSPNLFEAEKQVNTYTSGGQENPASAMNTAGDFVVVWESGPEFVVAVPGPALNTQDGSGKGIYAQRYNARGEKVGSEFRVNTYTEDDQSEPCVAIDNAGHFTIAWQSKGQNGNPGQTNIYAQRYTADGVAQGVEFLVDSGVNTYSRQNPTIGMLGNGQFLIGWEDLSPTNMILVKRYEADGTLIGSEITIGSINRIDIHPQINVNTDGKVILAYNQRATNGTNRTNYSLFAFDTAATPSSTSIVSINEIHPVGVPLENGGFVLFYESGILGSQKVVARTISESGGISGAFDVIPVQDLANFTAASTSTGQVVLSWQRKQAAQVDVFARRYASIESVKKFSDVFQVNTYQTNQQQRPAISVAPDGKFVVIWDGEGPDESGGVFGKGFAASENPLLDPG